VKQEKMVLLKEYSTDGKDPVLGGMATDGWKKKACAQGTPLISANVLLPNGGSYFHKVRHTVCETRGLQSCRTSDTDRQWLWLLRCSRLHPGLFVFKQYLLVCLLDCPPAFVLLVFCRWWRPRV
jgi:hypothetical protein